ncbi:MAG: hypothetical protein RLZ98_2718 [Pseudomonadota bacterium]
MPMAVPRLAEIVGYWRESWVDENCNPDGWASGVRPCHPVTAMCWQEYAVTLCKHMITGLAFNFQAGLPADDQHPFCFVLIVPEAVGRCLAVRHNPLQPHPASRDDSVDDFRCGRIRKSPGQISNNALHPRSYWELLSRVEIFVADDERDAGKTNSSSMQSLDDFETKAEQKRATQQAPPSDLPADPARADYSLGTTYRSGSMRVCVPSATSAASYSSRT